MVDLDVWEAAKGVALERLRAARTALAQAEREQQARCPRVPAKAPCDH